MILGLRFRKSVKIAPGVKLNIGKKSVGVSVGGKHGGVSFNSKTGARARISAPGTGLSYSTSLSSGKKRNSKKVNISSNSTYKPITNKKLSDYSPKSQNRFAVVYIVLGILCALMGVGVATISILFGVILILFGVLITISGIAILKKNKTKRSAAQEMQEINPNQDNTANMVYVFITPTGKIYHKVRGCAGEKCIRVDINEAKSKGYTACSKCEHSYHL